MENAKRNIRAARVGDRRSDSRRHFLAVTGSVFLVATLLAWPRLDAAGQWQEHAFTTAAMSVATSLDLASTFACRNPQFCSESNGVAAVFYNPRKPAYLIAADAVGVAAITVLGYKMRTSKVEALRRTWWVPAAAFTVGSLLAWQHNTRLLESCPECRRAP